MVLRRVNVGRILSSIAKDLKLDWSIQVTWKRRVLVNKFHLSMSADIAVQKLISCTNAPAVIFPGRWFIFRNRLSYWVIIYSYLQRFFKVGVLKTLYTIHRKTSVSKFLFNQPVSYYFFNKRLRRFLVDIVKLSRTPILQELLETPDFVFMEHICNYDIIKFNVNHPKWLFKPFETKCIHVKFKLREREKYSLSSLLIL